MRGKIGGIIQSIIILSLAIALAAGISPLGVKADAAKVYKLDATASDLNLSALGKKDQIPEGNYGTDQYFKFVGQNIRANSDTLIIELAKREGSSISFTVTGAANVVMSLSSNGNTNVSDGYLVRVDDGAEIIPSGFEKAIFNVTGADPVAVRYFNLPAGTYKFRSPDGSAHDNRGIRVFSITVTEYPDGKVPERKSWSDVPAPALKGITADNGKINVEYSAIIGMDGADSVTINMYGEDGTIIESKTISDDCESAKAFFTPASSGKYIFDAVLERAGEDSKITEKSSPFEFVLQLAQPDIKAVTNMGGGSVKIEWSEVPEADEYIVYYSNMIYSSNPNSVKVTETEIVLSGLDINAPYNFSVMAKGSGDRSSISSVDKMIRDRVDRVWVYSYFGQSVSESRNKIADLDEDAFTFKLLSCTYDADTGAIKDKGGKFTAYYDGISYYYTKIDAAKENFELTATFTVDYINPTPDGQEGFGLVIRDSIGINGISSSNFETNSASLIATKYETTIDGTKYSMKDGMGVRFTYGLTEANIKDGSMSTYGVCKMTPCQLENENLVKAGDVYTLTVKKTNTGYHCIFNGEEYILYGVDKLLQIDKEHVYVGFAAARGCNVTVTDVQFKTSDPAIDPEAQPEPDPTFNVEVAIVSPDTYGTSDYLLRFRANADGKAYVTDAMANKLAENIECKANEITEVLIKLKSETNTLNVNFEPKEGYINEKGEKPGSYFEVSKSTRVTVRTYENTEFYVAPGAHGSGKGTKDDPMDLLVALKFVLPGQKVILMDGTYKMDYQLKIVKGNSGKKDSYKYLIADTGAHPVLDFSNSSTGGFVCWGDYWWFEGFDVCNTRENVKGFQLAGNNNIVRFVNTYNNGDTGFQISGSTNDPTAEWPCNNTVYFCTSHDNADPAFNNADGFAAKLSVGEGNRFVGCIAYNNIDDGWDLYAKVQSGPIGAVVIEHCVAYNNGFLSDGRGFGDGNGFKLGGDGIAVEHILKNSIAYNNHNAGITSNSNPSAKVYSCVSYGNTGNGIALYGKGDSARNFEMSGVITMNNGGGDNLKEQDLTSKTNYLQKGENAENSEGASISKDIFVSVDVSKTPTRYATGYINMNGLFELVSDSGKEPGVGADMKDYPNPEDGQDPVPTGSEISPTGASDVTTTPKPTPVEPDQRLPFHLRNRSLFIAIASITGVLLVVFFGFVIIKRYLRKKKNK